MSRTKCLELKKKILGGLLLAIDPTSGSTNRITKNPSQAGWALFDQGELIDSGVIDIKASSNKETRMRDLLETLQATFDGDYDILALEDIPMFRGRGDFSISQTLIQACGVYIAGVSGQLIEMKSMTWQAIAKRLGGWTKGDESDAIFIGISCIVFAEGYNQKLSEKKKLEALDVISSKYDYWDQERMKTQWELTE